jgi:predicted PurR-regulated permease PerM
MLTSQKQLISVFFFALLIFVVWQLIQIFYPFFQAFFWAAILSFAFYPVASFLKRKLKNANLSSAITMLIIFSVVIIPSLFVLANLIIQTFEIYQYLSGGGLTIIVEKIQNLQWIHSINESLMGSKYFSDYFSDLPSRTVHAIGNVVTTYLARGTKNVLLIAFNFILMLFMIFFITRDGDKIYKFIYRLVPFEEKERMAIFSKINETFASVIRGQFLTSLVQGILAGLTFLFLGLPVPHLIGFLTFISSLIPVIGASAVWFPFAVYLLIQQEFTKGIALLLIGIFCISLIDNFLKPALIGERIKMPPFLLFFGILGGLRLYGMMGVFLGPILMTLFFVLIQIYHERYRI